MSEPGTLESWGGGDFGMRARLLFLEGAIPGLWIRVVFGLGLRGLKGN